MNARFWAIGAVAAAIAVSSCENITLQEESGIKTITELTAVSGEDLPDTKTVINLNNGYDIRWTSGDAINVFFGASEGSRFVTQTSGDIAQFKGSIDVVTGGGEGLNDDTSLWGVYPYSSMTTCDGSSITYTLPSVQEAKAGSFAEDLFPQIARSKNFYMTFYNLCGSFRFRLSNPDIVKVTLRGNNNEPIAGRAKISMDGAPAVSEILEGSEELVMYAPDGECFETDEWYLFVLYPTAFENGLTITFYKEDSQASYVYSKSYTLNRNKFSYFDKSDAGLTFEKVEDEDDQGNIVFADAVMKEMCVNAFDTNDDGELSFSEAAAVTSLDAMSITDKTIKSFDEFQYFTGVEIIPENYFSGTEIQSLIIPDSVTSIGDYAFSVCSSLTEITVPDSVTSIGEQCFCNCSSLKEISLSNSLTSIGDSAFAECSSLTGLRIPDSVTHIGDRAFENCTSLKEISLSNSLTSISWRLFFGCSSLAGILIPDSVTNIGNQAFQGCIGLATDLIVPDNVEEIGDYAFAACSGLIRVLFTDSLESIGEGAFCECDNLVSVSFPEYVENLGDYMFNGCFSLTNVSLPKSIMRIGTQFFSYCISLTNMTIPDSVTTIDEFAFAGCSGLTSMIIPESVTSICNYAFSECKSLGTVSMKSLTPPECGQWAFGNNAPGRKFFVPAASVDIYKSADGWSEYADYIVGDDCIIGNIVFSDPTMKAMCINAFDTDMDKELSYVEAALVRDLSKMIITDKTIKSFDEFQYFTGVEIIPENYFSFTEIQSLIIPDSVTSIGDYAFSGCSSLTEITVPDSVTSIGEQCFCNCSSLKEISLSNSLTSIGDVTFANCSSLTGLRIPDSVTHIGDRAFENCTSLKEISLSNSLTSISWRLFFGCSSLAGILIPDSVTSIGKHAFCGCSGLTGELIIPDLVTTIGEYAFDQCSSLIGVLLPDSLESIGEGAFYECSSLTSMSFPESVVNMGGNMFRCCSSLKSILLPKNATSIGNDYCFGCSSLVSISIPESVTIISDYAFWECDSLESVIMNNVTPPECGSSVFSNNASGMKILVPSASVDAYKSADGWSEYANYIEGVD